MNYSIEKKQSNNYKLKDRFIVNLCSNIYDGKQKYFKKIYFYLPPYFLTLIKKIFGSKIRYIRINSDKNNFEILLLFSLSLKISWININLL